MASAFMAFMLYLTCCIYAGLASVGKGNSHWCMLWALPTALWVMYAVLV